MDKRRALRLSAEHRGLLVGGWRILGYLAHGGSAVVLRAVRDDVTAALKVIDQEIVDKFGRNEQIERVTRERLLIGHDHPNLVQIYDAGVCDRTDFLFVAMEFLDSPTLTELIPNFPSEHIYPAISQIASAARYLEDMDLVHRDIKPDNVVLTRDFSKATLLDLGVLRPFSNLGYDITTASSFLGTTRYSSPEYLLREGEEESVNGWRALTFYQLGGLLHDMIMRRPLFDDIDGPPARLTDAVRYNDPLVESDEVHSRITSLAKSCLQKDWELRLKLVSWDNFVQLSTEASIDETEAMVAERIGVQTSRGTTRIDDPVTGSRRHAIQRLESRITSVLRQQCTDVGLFPPFRIDSKDHPERNCIEIRLQTGPSNKHAISQPLILRLDATVLDFASMQISIKGIGAFGEVTFGTEQQGITEVFVGQTDASEMGEGLRRFAVLALDAAQRQIVFPNTNVLVIEPGGQGC